MHESRRRFLLASGAAVSALALPRVSMAATSDAGAKPLPELVAERDLAVFQLDVAESIKRTSLVWGNGRSPVPPQGAIIEIPAGSEIPIKWWSWTPRPNSGITAGARLILRGTGKGPKPRLFSPGGEGVIGPRNSTGQPVGFEMENLELVGGYSGECVNAQGFRFVRLSKCEVRGGKNGFFLPSGRVVALLEDCLVHRGGRGDGYTHTAYVNYIEKFIARRTTFKASKAQGHAFKCYAADIDLRDCVFANWETTEELSEGFHGELPVMDLGAWANTRLVNNTIIRRGPTRLTCLEYRNRQWAKGVNQYVEPTWGTDIVDYHQVDNRDPANPHLYHHFLVGNRFINGVLPDGSQDPRIKSNRGIAVRNNGATPWGSHGEMVSKVPHPADFQPQNERSVVWAVGNAFEGVPFDKQFEEVPGEQPQDRAPIRVLDQLPAWARLG